MKKKKHNAGADAIDKFFKTHRRHCAIYIFSSDHRHCSCGRDAALIEIERLRQIERDHHPADPIQQKLFTQPIEATNDKK